MLMCSLVATHAASSLSPLKSWKCYSQWRKKEKKRLYRQGKSRRNPFLEPYQVTCIKSEPQQPSSDSVVYNLRLLAQLFSLYDRFHEAKYRNNSACRGSKLSRGSKVHVIFSRYTWRHSLTHWRHSMEGGNTSSSRKWRHAVQRQRRKGVTGASRMRWKWRESSPGEEGLREVRLVFSFATKENGKDIIENEGRTHA